MSQLTLTWTHTKGPSKEVDLQAKTCVSYLIEEALDRLIGMGYTIDSIVPVQYKGGIILESAAIVISKPDRVDFLGPK